ncbi:MAG: hypothetical protein IKV03_03205 [Alphaproteobacteria bacterium]|nr:hypothetical protein [Alphaproteobacteria bacterium]
MSHIKLHGVKPRIQYIANGTLTTYEFPFVIFSNTDIQVYLNNVLQNKDTYAVSGVKNTNGGCITFITPPMVNTVITITRDLSIERTSDFQEGGALRANVLNDEFDYQTACLQQVADSINRSMILPPYATDTDVDLTLPTPSAGRAIVWNSDGTNLENSAVKVNELESTLRGYKETAESACATAVEKSQIAFDSAQIASEQAQIATQKADEAKETLNSKASQDLDNLSEMGKEQIAYFAMPSKEYIDLTLGASNSTYTAPANGYMILTKMTTGAQGIQFFVNGTDKYTCDYMACMNVYTNGTSASTWIPVKKNDIITYNYTAGGALTHFRFIYAQGEI